MSGDARFVIRPATADDVTALGRLGALLMRTHYAFDAQRFLPPGRNPERDYGRFLVGQLQDEDAAVMVADRDGVVVGYVYAALEPLSWKELRAACGFVHDLAVEEDARRRGAAAALLESAVTWLRERGAPRVVLGTADKNTAAQRLFEKHGFRRTMVEMTREL